MELIWKKTISFANWPQIKSLKYKDEINDFRKLRNSFYTIHSANLTVTNEKVTIWELEPEIDNINRANAINYIQHIKKIRHPSILKYIDEDIRENSVTLITENVVPLEEFIENSLNLEPNIKESILLWGIVTIFKLLNFLKSSCSLIHSNLGLHSVFVNERYEWKLGGFEFARNIESTPICKPQYMKMYEYTIDPAMKGEEDLWHLAILINEIFNGYIDGNSLSNTNKIPKCLVKPYLLLLSTQSRMQKINYFQSAEFFRSAFIIFMDDLESLQVKSHDEVIDILKKNERLLNIIPLKFHLSKILPALITRYRFGGFEAELAYFSIEILSRIDSESYVTPEIIEFIIELFLSKDRGTRYQLLKNENILQFIPSNDIEAKIFPSLVGGFLDTVPAIRESTLKIVVRVIDKISPKTIKNKLLRHLAKLQQDEHPIIRANTNICIGKIAKYLPNDILTNALIKGLKDPYSLSRRAVLASFSNSVDIFTIEQLCTKIIPEISIKLIDQDPEIRRISLNVIEKIIKRIETLLPTLPLMNDNSENDINKVKDNIEGWFLSALSTFTLSETIDTSNEQPAMGAIKHSKISIKDDKPIIPNIKSIPSSKIIPDLMTDKDISSIKLFESNTLAKVGKKPSKELISKPNEWDWNDEW